MIISFHSLEDRIVKDALREGAKQGHYGLLTKKPVTASEEEIDRNPRSRSAKIARGGKSLDVTNNDEATKATNRIRSIGLW